MTSTNLVEFIEQWGICDHPKPDPEHRFCPECLDDPSQRSFSMSEAAELDHERQVAIFNWCGCEDGERQYDDCPNHNQGENHD